VLQHSKNAHMRQIEQMESEELLAQKKLRTEVIQLEDMLAQVPKEVLWIPDPNFFHPGSQSRIFFHPGSELKNLSILTKK
jgi:hypothetical protein